MCSLMPGVLYDTSILLSALFREECLHEANLGKDVCRQEHYFKNRVYVCVQTKLSWVLACLTILYVFLPHSTKITKIKGMRNPALGWSRQQD